MTLKPLADRVLIRVEEAKTKTTSGLYLPDSATKERTKIGTVKAVGDDKEAIVVKVGQRVMYDTYKQSLEVDGEELLVIKMEDIVAIVVN